MTTELTVQEFNSIITQRVLLDKLQMRGQVREEFYYSELISNTLFTLGPVLREHGLGEVWGIKNKLSTRVYLLHSLTKRLVCEVGIVADRLPNGKYGRPRVVLVNRKEIIAPSESLNRLVEATAARGPRRPYVERTRK